MEHDNDKFQPKNLADSSHTSDVDVSSGSTDRHAHSFDGDFLLGDDKRVSKGHSSPAMNVHAGYDIPEAVTAGSNTPSFVSSGHPSYAVNSSETLNDSNPPNRHNNHLYNPSADFTVDLNTFDSGMLAYFTASEQQNGTITASATPVLGNQAVPQNLSDAPGPSNLSINSPISNTNGHNHRARPKTNEKACRDKLSRSFVEVRRVIYRHKDVPPTRGRAEELDVLLAKYNEIETKNGELEQKLARLMSEIAGRPAYVSA